jgi:hypothetical protein
MESLLGNDPSDTAVLNGGPLDGREHPVDTETADLRVIMTDGQQHLYGRTSKEQLLPDGRTAHIYEWKGRYFGPK